MSLATAGGGGGWGGGPREEPGVDAGPYQPVAGGAQGAWTRFERRQLASRTMSRNAHEARLSVEGAGAPDRRIHSA